VIIAATALVASVIGGVAGYGTGALMPLVLVPIVGAEPVVPILSLSALLTNASRVAAYRRFVDARRATIVLASAAPTCALGAWAYARLSGAGALVVIGSMLILSVPLRRLLRRRGLAISYRGLALAAFGWGPLAGGTVGAGIILLSLLMAAGVEGAAVIATDAVVSIGIGVIKLATFGVAGAVTAKVIADRGRGFSRRLRRARHGRASADPSAYRAARCCGDRRRRGHDRQCARGVASPFGVTCFWTRTGNRAIQFAVPHNMDGAEVTSVSRYIAAAATRRQSDQARGRRPENA